MIKFDPVDVAVMKYVRVRSKKGVSYPQVRQEVEMILNGVRDARIPDDAIIIIDALK